VLLLDVGYGSAKTMVGRACEQSGATAVEVKILLGLPVSAAPDRVVAAVAAAITERTRLCVFDETTSNTALRLPAVRGARAISDCHPSEGASNK
jgi:isopenicillin-N epimerase